MPHPLVAALCSQQNAGCVRRRMQRRCMGVWCGVNLCSGGGGAVAVLAMTIVCRLPHVKHPCAAPLQGAGISPFIFSRAAARCVRRGRSGRRTAQARTLARASSLGLPCCGTGLVAQGSQRGWSWVVRTYVRAYMRCHACTAVARAHAGGAALGLLHADRSRPPVCGWVGVALRSMWYRHVSTAAAGSATPNSRRATCP